MLVGLFAVAIGTSLPEITLSIRLASKHEAAVLYGNILGSVMTNSMLVVGTAAMIRPIEVRAIDSYLLATLAYIVIFWSFWFFTRSKHKLERREGAILIVLYVIFVVIEFLKENGYGAELKTIFDWLARQAALFV